MNNPLSYTDPSGYFLESLIENVANFMDTYGRTIVAITIANAFPPGYAVLGGMISGYIASNGNMEAAVTGGITAGAFSGIGAATETGSLGPIGKIFAHGMVGGVSSVMQGGKFGSGFMAASFTAAVSVASGDKLFDNNPHGLQRVTNAFKAAMIGGTASVIGGGKFENGAVTGAFSRMFNDDADDGSDEDGETDTESQNEKIYFDEEATRAMFKKLWPSIGLPDKITFQDREVAQSLFVDIKEANIEIGILKTIYKVWLQGVPRQQLVREMVKSYASAQTKELVKGIDEIKGEALKYASNNLQTDYNNRLLTGYWMYKPTNR